MSAELVEAVQVNHDVIRSLEDEINDLLGELERGMQVAAEIAAEPVAAGSPRLASAHKQDRRRYENVELS